jgi:YVTN family beta-propeller protein
MLSATASAQNAYITNQFSNDITVINTTDNSVVTTIPQTSATEPNSVAVIATNNNTITTKGIAVSSHETETKAARHYEILKPQ